MTITDAPERIWARKSLSENTNEDMVAWRSPSGADELEYVRADLFAAALQRVLAEALEDVHEADSLELAQHGQSKIVERILARAAEVKETKGDTYNGN
jgi:hypothetical protein